MVQADATLAVSTAAREVVGVPQLRSSTSLDRVGASALQESVPFAPCLYLEASSLGRPTTGLLQHLPETGGIAELRHREACGRTAGAPAAKFYLFPEHIGLLPPAQRAVWLDVSCVLRSPELQAALKRKFRRALEARQPVHRAPHVLSRADAAPATSAATASGSTATR